MRFIQHDETGRTLAWDTFGIDWQTLGYTLKFDAIDPHGTLRTSTISASGTYPNGGQIIGTSSLFPIKGNYTCRVYEQNDLLVSSQFVITIE
jgi:hypothetical protein